MRSARSLFDAVEAALAGEVANPGVIGINFTAGVHALPPWHAGGAFWNNVGGHRGANVALSASDGSATSARLSFESASAYAEYGAPNTLNAATNALYRGGLVGNDTMSEVLVRVTDVPFRRYDVLVFASADTHDRSTLSITDGRTTSYYRSAGAGNTGAGRLLRTRSEDGDAPTDGPAQYQIFAARTGDTFELVTGGSRHCVLSNNVFGLQIVNRTRDE